MGARVNGNVNPLKLKPVPEAAAAVMVTLLLPLFVNVTVCDVALPITTLPKLMLDGLAVRSPAATPAPERGRFTVPVSVVKAMLPVTAPLAAGANNTLKLTLSPAASVTGTVIPVTLNPDPVTAICDIVRVDCPVLVTVAFLVWVVPICTLPKLTLDGDGVSTPGPWSCAFPPRPWQPTSPMRPATTSNPQRQLLPVLKEENNDFKICPPNRSFLPTD